MTSQILQSPLCPPHCSLAAQIVATEEDNLPLQGSPLNAICGGQQVAFSGMPNPQRQLCLKGAPWRHHPEGWAGHKPGSTTTFPPKVILSYISCTVCRI